MKFRIPGVSQAGMAALREAWTYRRTTEPLVVTEASRLSELDTEMEGFRSLTAERLEEPPWKTERVQRAAYSLWLKNHMARRLLEIPVDFIVGDGVSVVARHETEATSLQIQEVIDDFWNDPINNLADEIEVYARELLLWGEVCLPRRVRELDGKCRLGWVCPLDIEDVEPDPITGEPGVVVLKDDVAKTVGQKRLAVIRYLEGPEEWVGDCFYYSINRPKGRCRGTSELFSAMVWIGIMEQTMLGQADRAKLNSAFIWDVLLKGHTPEMIKEWLTKHGRRPKPNEIRAHNENVEWKTVQPDLSAYEFERHIKTMFTFILGGYGYPNHWFGSGDDANLATASVMAEPTRKSLRRKQKVFSRMIAEMVQDALLQAERYGRLPAGVAADRPFDVQVPDLSGPDIGKSAAAIQGLIAGVIAAEEAGLMSHDTAMDVVAVAVAETGIEIDSAAEREKVRAEAEERERKEAEEAMAKEKQLQAALVARGARQTTVAAPAEE